MAFDPNAPFEVVGTAPPPTPRSLVPAAPPTFDPSAPFEVAPPEAPSRFMVNAGEGFRGLLAGEARERFISGQVAGEAAAQREAAAGRLGPDGRSLPAPRPRGGLPFQQVAPTYDLTPEELAADAARLRAEEARRGVEFRTEILPQRRAEEAAIGPWNQGSLGNRIVQGAEALAGQIVGSMLSPESFIGPIGATARRFAGEGIVPYVARQAAESGTPNALIGGAVDPVVQGGEIERGTREAYSPAETAAAAAIGGLIGTSLPISVETVRALIGRVRGARGAQPAAPGAPEADVPPQDIEAVITDQDVLAIARANGITDPNDPRVAQALERLATRRAAEANPEAARMAAQAARPAPSQEGGGDPGTRAEVARERATAAAAVERIDAQVGREAAAAAQAGRPYDAAAARARLMAAEGAQRPEIGTITVGPSGAAVPFLPDGTLSPETRGAVEGAVARSRPEGRGALVPVDPQPNRMTPGDITRAAAQIEGGNQNGAEPPPRLVAPEGGAPRDPEGIEQRRQAGEAFAQADARRARRDGALADGEAPPADVRAGGRPEGRGEPEVFAFLDARVADGQMVAGRRVDVLARDAAGNAAVRDPETGTVEIVSADRLTERGRPESPRMAQEFTEAARTPPRGVGAEGPQPREATDRITSRQPANPRGPDDGGEYVGRGPLPDGPVRDVPGDPALSAPRAPEARAPEAPPAVAGEPRLALPAPEARGPAIRLRGPEAETAPIQMGGPEAPRAAATPPAPEAPRPASDAPNPRAEAFTAQAEKSRAAAERLEGEATTLRAVRDRFFDAATGRSRLAEKGLKVGRSKADREALALAQKYRDRAGITKAIERKEDEARAARGREKIQRRGAETEGRGERAAFDPTYSDARQRASVGNPDPAPPERFSYAVRRHGGVRGVAGELEGARPGVRNERGLSVDQMIQALREDGWFPNRAGDQNMTGEVALDISLAERDRFFDMLRDDQGKQPVFRDGDAVDFADARARADAEGAALDDIAREFGLEPGEWRGLSRGQFEDLLAERMSQERLAEADRLRAEAERAEVDEIRRMAEDGRGDAWEPDIRADLEDFLDGYGTRSLEDAEAEWRGGDGDGEPGARGSPEGAAPSREPGGEGRIADEASEASPVEDGAGDAPRGDGEAGRGADTEGVGGEPRNEGPTPYEISQAREFLANQQAYLDRIQREHKPGDQVPAGRMGGDSRGGPYESLVAELERRIAAETRFLREAGEAVPGRDPLRRTTEDNGQTVLSGAEASTRQATQARAEAPNRGRAPQRGVEDFALFDPDAAKQTDLIDNAGRLAGDEDFKGRLFSGGIFDPAVWRWAFGGATRYLGEPFQRSWNEATKALRASSERGGTEKRVPRDPNSFWSKMPNPARSTAYWTRAVLYADDARMRYVADLLPSDASRAAARTFLDRWHARAGDAREAGGTFDERVDRESNRFMRRVAKGISPELLTDDAAMKQIVRLVQNPQSIRRGTPMGDAAQAITDILRDLRDYQVKAGVEMGRVDRGYFPRMVDIDAVWKNRDGFLTAAERMYRRMGEPDPKAQAQAWLDNILAGGKHDNVLAMPNNGIHADHVNKRTLPKEADEILRDFMHQDPRHVLTAYVLSGTRRAEFARAVGGADQTHWKALTDALKADGAHARIEEFQDYVNNLTGVRYAGANRTLVRATSNIRMFAALGLLEKATISSLAEVVMPAVRAGRVQDIGRGLYKTVDDLVRGTRGNGDAVRLRELAEDIGIISSAHAGSLNVARWTGGDAQAGFQSLALEKYFRRIGLEQWTRATRVAALSTAEVFLRRMGSDLLRQNEKGAWRGMNGRVAANALSELGIPRARQEDFARWVAQHGNGMSASSLGTAPADMAEMFRTATGRFVDQSIMRPSAATRPRWASTPLGAVAFQLNNFAWAFHKNVLQRPVNILRSEDLTALDKTLYAGRIIMGISMMLPAQAAISAVRSELFDDPRSTERRRQQAARDPLFHSPITGDPVGSDQAMLALSRSGLLGGFDPAFNLVTGVRYGRDLATSIAGPALGTVLGAAQTGIESFTRNSPNTNNAERRMARAAYDSVIEPSANLALTFLPVPVAAVATQAIGHGATRGAFIDAVAGEERRDNRRRRE